MRTVLIGRMGRTDSSFDQTVYSRRSGARKSACDGSGAARSSKDYKRSVVYSMFMLM